MRFHRFRIAHLLALVAITATLLGGYTVYERYTRLYCFRMVDEMGKVSFVMGSKSVDFTPVGYMAMVILAVISIRIYTARRRAARGLVIPARNSESESR